MIKSDKSAGLNQDISGKNMRAMKEKQIEKEKEGLEKRQIRIMDMEYISRVVSSCIIAN